MQSEVQEQPLPSQGLSQAFRMCGKVALCLFFKASASMGWWWGKAPSRRKFWGYMQEQGCLLPR